MFWGPKATVLACLPADRFHAPRLCRCPPADAVRAFQLGHLDVLAIGPYVVENPQAKERVRVEEAVLREN